MDPSSAQNQDMSSHNSLENMLGGCSKPQPERKPRPQPEHAINCPRCDSTNTKFCYYNNYSLSQPRYFCKSCRRYWTKGGTLRNVPVGGGCRKNKRPSKRSQDDPLTTNPNQLPNLSQFTYDSNDLTLAFARLQKQPPTGHLGFDDRHLSIMNNSTRCDLLGNSIPSSSCAATTPTPGFGNFLETPFNGNFHDFYYGSYGNGNNMGEVENVDQQQLPYEDYMSSAAATTTAVTVTTMKQELSDDSHRGEGIDQNRVLWGFPWQLSGDGNMGIPEHHVDHSSGRESWINGLAPSWHGLLNSPLM